MFLLYLIQFRSDRREPQESTPGRFDRDGSRSLYSGLCYAMHACISVFVHISLLVITRVICIVHLLLFYGQFGQYLVSCLLVTFSPVQAVRVTKPKIPESIRKNYELM